MPKILLDSGHVGEKWNKSPCNTSPVYYESAVMWKLHEMLKADLIKQGFTVATTRASIDEKLGSYERGLKAKGYDLFLSLHSNAAGDNVREGVDRPVIIYPLISSAQTKFIANLIGSKLESVLGTKQHYQLFQREHPTEPLTDYYGVIRGAVKAGCNSAFLVETTFHTDTRMTKKLLNTNTLKAISTRLSEELADFYGITKPKRFYTVIAGQYYIKEKAVEVRDALKKAGYTASIREE